MVRLSKLFIGFAIMIMVCGCSNMTAQNEINKITDPQLSSTINKCMAASGVANKDSWAFDADAVATIYEEDGKTLISQKHFFSNDEGNIAVKIDSSGTEVISEAISKHDKLTLCGCLCPSNSSECAAARLEMYSIAISSLSPLLEKDINLAYVTKEKKGGTCCHIIEAKGNILSCCKRAMPDKSISPDTVKVWINEETGNISRIWFKYLKNGNAGDYGYISANIGDYVKYSNGLSLPTSIEYIPSDSTTGESSKTMLKIDIQRFRFAGNDNGMI